MAKSINDMLENVLGEKPDDKMEREICAVVQTKKYGKYDVCLKVKKRK